MYRLDAKHQAVVEKAAKVADASIAPHAAEVDKNGSFPRAALEALGAAGLLGVNVPVAYGGLGEGLRTMCAVLDQVAQRCPSTAMIYKMHLCAIANYAAAPTPPAEQLKAAAAGKHLATLAWSEKGSRSHFWAPMSQAVVANGGVTVSAEKSWVTSAGEADSYSVSTRWSEAKQPTDTMLYMVLKGDPGVSIAGPWDGMGLRGNASAPMRLEDTPLAASRALCADGKGFETMLGVVLPVFNLGNAAVSVGIAEAACAATQKHLTGSRFGHLGSPLSDLPTLRARLARMRIETDKARAHLACAVDSIENPGPATTLLVLESKAQASETAIAVTDDAMRACGGAAFSKHLDLDRYFRDARAGAVMAPTSDVIQEFIGRALCGMELFLMADKPILVGAVLYDPKVSVIWDIIRDFFEAQGCPIDVVFYTNYELQVDALVKGHIDIAWNSPLAWVDCVRQTGGTCRAIAMRDTDRDRVSHLVVKADAGLGSLGDLRGKTVALGAKDSPQATLIPTGLLQRAGLEPGQDFEVKRFDVLVGKHGDHVGGELEAFRCLAAGNADASAMLDLNWQAWTADGTVNPDAYRILATTDRFDHCVFTVLASFAPAREKAFLDALFAMTYDNPQHREMMDLEGLKAWEPGRTSGFGPLSEAVERQAYFQDQPA